MPLDTTSWTIIPHQIEIEQELSLSYAVRGMVPSGTLRTRWQDPSMNAVATRSRLDTMVGAIRVALKNQRGRPLRRRGRRHGPARDGPAAAGRPSLPVPGRELYPPPAA